MPYTTLTLASALTLLASRLADPGFVQWTSLELTAYLREALRTWQALTGSTKATSVFNTTPPAFDPAYFDPAYFGFTIQIFYHLPTVVPLTRAHTVLTTDLVTDLEYALVEPPTPTVWTGTAQFSLTDLTSALQQRRDRFLSETRAVQTYRQLPMSPPSPTGRMALDQTILGIQRLAWQDGLTGVITPLRRDDEWGYTNYRRGWPQNPGLPRTFSVSATPPLEVQFAPPPIASGIVDALIIVSGSPVDPTLPGQMIGVPDDWAWVVKWGALADLLGRDGLALDPTRSQYCEARWAQGIELAKAASVVLTARINDVPCRVETVANLDQYRTTWQTTLGVPTLVATAGHNLVAVPASGATLGPSWSITLDLVPNMPVPSATGDFLQVGGDTLDLILDYAAHLATFKLGGAQLIASQPLLDRFLAGAGISADRRLAWRPNRLVPAAPLPEADWSPGTSSTPVGVS